MNQWILSVLDWLKWDSVVMTASLKGSISSVYLGSSVWTSFWLTECPMLSSSCGSYFLQRKRETSSSVLWQMRRQLLLELTGILPTVRSTRIVDEADAETEPHVSVYSGLKEEHVVKASALLRLYCALMGIAGLKYSIIWYFTFLSFYFLVSNPKKVSQRPFILRIWVFCWA